MHQWSPDDLYEQSVAVAGGEEFTREKSTEGTRLDFVEDFPSDGLGSFMNRLDLSEREALYQMIRDEQRQEIEQEVEEKYADTREHDRSVIEALATRLEEKVDEDLKSIAHSALDLSLAMAEQITRRVIELDRSVLQSAIETIIYRAKRGTKFTVVVNPDDAHYMQERPDDLARLNIVEIEIDQRIERGGCLVTADGQEWDYTVSGRLDRLTEVVRESILESKSVSEDSP